MSFQIEINKAAEEFKKIKEKTVGIISHNDTDGITSAAIIAKALARQGINFQTHIITRKEENILDLIKQKKYKVFFLLDYGSQEINAIAKEIIDVDFFVLDHHPPGEKKEFSNVVHINPHFYGINGGSDACAATVCYFFAKALAEKNKDLAALAVVGAIGDSQRKNSNFSGLNQEMFEQALKEGGISTKKGLKFYGWSSRPLHKALSYSTDPFIPGISGSESAAVQFIKELGIPLKKDDDNWRTVSDLSEDEIKKLTAALIVKRHSVENPADIFEEKIILSEFNIEELKEAEAFSVALNSLAKMEQFGLAMGVAFGNQGDYEESKKIMQEYKKQIINGMNYFYDNRSNPKIVKETEKAIYFFSGEALNSNLISTISTILSVNLEAKGKAIFCFSKENDLVKVSARFIGKKPENINLGKFCNETTLNLGGQGGGHSMAAGATIPAGKEEMFINAFEERVSSNG